MKTTETHWSCDICGKDKITVAGGFYIKTGFSVPGGDNVGVGIECQPLGPYREHICQACAESAILELADQIKSRAILRELGEAE